MRRNDQGFTLMEMLIVIAIIAVLIAIAIPIFTSTLERSREATDAANIRSNYAEVMVEAISENEAVNADGSFGRVVLIQQIGGWQNEEYGNNLNELVDDVIGEPTPDGYAWVSYDPAASGAVVLHYEGGSGGGGDSGGGDSPGGTVSANTPYIPAGRGITLDHNNNAVTLTSPFDVVITIEVQVHAGGSGSSAEKETQTVDLPANESYTVVFSQGYNNSVISLQFGEDVSEADALALYNSMVPSTVKS